MAGAYTVRSNGKGMMDMKAYDPQQAARVWQRVQNQKPEQKEELPRGSDLPALILAERMAAAAYLQLARQMPQQEARLRRMAQEEQSHAAALEGMYCLTTGERAAVKPAALQREPVEASLRRCYSGELKSLAEYEARCNDPEFGHVFAGMAAQERQHCRNVLEMLGTWNKGK